MEPWSLPFSIAAFVIAALATVAGGVRLAHTGDVLADRTGWGEALFGAVFFGAIISASGVVMSAASALAGQAQLAYTSAVGGIAAQTVALVVADMFHRGANLEHAAASLQNMLFAVVLSALLLLAIGLSLSPEMTLWGVHPGSLGLLLAYAAGFRIVQSSRSEPGWVARTTRATVRDEPDDARSKRSSAALWAEFLAVGLLVAGGGWVIARTAEVFVERGGLQASLVGAAFMGIVNAIPEAVTSISAVRRGALTLAMAGVLGGNCFDVLNLAIADVAYRPGSLYHAATRDDLFLSIVSALLTMLILGGMLRRQLRGPGGIGLEGWLVLGVYALAMAAVALPDAR
jgi:cation:H+ antiporter